MTRRAFLEFSALAALPLAAARGQDRNPNELLWERPPKQLTPQEFAGGVDGIDGAPAAPFEFVEEDDWGTNPKVRVRDANGKVWVAKWGDEVHSEVFATRLVSAAGYFVRPVYYVAGGVMENVGKLGRASDKVDDQGRFADASFKFLDEKLPYVDGHDWAWSRNPFLESPEGLRRLNGLKILMMLTSNWDGKDATDPDAGPNTAIYERKGPPQALLYAFDDWGATMGSWGGVFSRSKWNPEEYEAQSEELVESIDGDVVQWGYGGKNESEIKSGIRVADVKWLVERLGYLTAEHIDRALTAAGADEESRPIYVRALGRRFDALKSVT